MNQGVRAKLDYLTTQEHPKERVRCEYAAERPSDQPEDQEAGPRRRSGRELVKRGGLTKVPAPEPRAEEQNAEDAAPWRKNEAQVEAVILNGRPSLRERDCVREPLRVLPNGMRLSCGAGLEYSQMKFYHRRRAPPASSAG